MNSLDIPRKCIVLRNGKELWIPAAKAEALFASLQSGGESRLIKFEEEDAVINTADITGIFTPSDMEELANTKRGMWKCSEGNWHGRFEFQNQEDGGICDCPQTFGNKVLSAGSFDVWAVEARRTQEWQATMIDKKMAPLQKERAEHEKSIERVKAMLNFTAEQKIEWILKQWQQHMQFTNINDRTALENTIKEHQSAIVTIDKQLDELRSDKKSMTTDFFSSQASFLKYIPNETYPMTPQQVSDFEDFLKKQVW